MKLENVREAYYEYSRNLSNINRQLALSGVAIIWFFVHPAINQNLNFGVYKCSFILFCCALFCDLCHYAIATLIWGSYHRYKEKTNRVMKDFKAPSVSAKSTTY